MNPKGDAIPQSDLLRIAAAAVVCLHASAGVVLNPLDTLPQWWAGNIGDAASRWSVPLFVMVSGALLLNDNRSFTPMQFYTRRAARLLIPTIFGARFIWLTDVSTVTPASPNSLRTRRKATRIFTCGFFT